jgi:protein TonB
VFPQKTIMKPTRQKRGSTIGGVITWVAILALVVFAGLRLNQARTRLMGEVDGLQAELSTAQTRIEDLQIQMNAERAARAQAEATAAEAGAAAVEARQVLQSHQEKLGNRIQELETSVHEYEQQVAAAVEARTRAETELSRETVLRKAVEQEVADVANQLQQHEALLSRLQRPSGTPAEVDAGTGARATSTVAMTETESRAGATHDAGTGISAGTRAGASTAFDTPPKPLDLVPPQYPHSLRMQGTEGNVVVAFTVNTRGRVQDVEVWEATNSEFGTAAVAAVRKWRFKPALRSGEPVEVRISQQLAFTNN